VVVSSTKLVILAIVVAVAIVIVALRRDAVDVLRTPDPTDDQETPSAANASRSEGSRDDDETRDDAPALLTTPPLRRRPLEPTHAQPAHIEGLVLQIIARQPGLEAGSLSVACDDATCEIALTGREVSPVRLSEFGDLLDKVFRESRGDFRVLLGGMGTREIAPGAREYVMTFEYQPYEELSHDPTIAARQQAACAAAWRRLTENPTPEDVVRDYLEEEERRLALATAVLGRGEAERLEAERLAIRGGPLHRECHL
jgi:hypothetical protein